MVRAEGMQIFDFDNPRLLEKAQGQNYIKNYFYLLKITKTTSQKC